MNKSFSIHNNVELNIFTSDEQSFMITSTVISSGENAVLIGAQFTQTHAKEILSFLKSNGLNLKEIYVTHGDPDYYFGTEVFVNAYPNVTISATAATIQHIKESSEGKLAFWGPQLKEDAPKQIILPQEINGTSVNFAGTTFSVVGSDSTRTNLWDETSHTLIGGIDTFNEIHVFLADTKEINQLQAWKKRVGELLALSPELVIPSHGAEDKSFNSSALQFTADYLQLAIDILSEGEVNSADFLKKVEAVYPNLRNEAVLGLGSKVVTKEIPWA